MDPENPTRSAFLAADQTSDPLQTITPELLAKFGYSPDMLSGLYHTRQPEGDSGNMSVIARIRKRGKELWSRLGDRIRRRTSQDMVINLYVLNVYTTAILSGGWEYVHRAMLVDLTGGGHGEPSIVASEVSQGAGARCPIAPRLGSSTDEFQIVWCPTRVHDVSTAVGLPKHDGVEKAATEVGAEWRRTCADDCGATVVNTTRGFETKRSQASLRAITLMLGVAEANPQKAAAGRGGPSSALSVRASIASTDQAGLRFDPEPRTYILGRMRLVRVARASPGPGFSFHPAASVQTLEGEQAVPEQWAASIVSTSRAKTKGKECQYWLHLYRSKSTRRLALPRVEGYCIVSGAWQNRWGSFRKELLSVRMLAY
ncbi:hypothetical protein B0H11DRAFT_2195582 [Mycena galericulata]|nr:hypothetical protein B0H11DRAFT_2195582 [Mycena galericulata]